MINYEIFSNWEVNVPIVHKMKENMRIIFVILTITVAGSTLAQDRALMYSASTETYLGLGYMRFGEMIGFGINFRSNMGTWNTFPQTDKYEMNENSILDGGDYSWEYDEEYEYDRGSITGRLYLKMSTKDYASNWIYFGVGPGWVRHWYGYNWSGGSETEYVMDRTQSILATEWEGGFMHMSDSFMWLLGVTNINFKENWALTFGIGVPF